MTSTKSRNFGFGRSKESILNSLILIFFIFFVTSVVGKMAKSAEQIESIPQGRMQTPDSKEKQRIKNVRLPKNIKPLLYYVRLRPYIYGNFTFDGHVQMTFEALQDTMNVTLHIYDIITKNETIKIVLKESSKEVKIKSHKYDHERQFYIAQLGESLKKDKIYVISMDFVGYLNTQLRGFYRSSYKDKNGKTKWLATTQFQATAARKAFPCMDEPGLKANFIIEIGRKENMTSLSNMPLNKTVPMEGEPGWFWDKFEESVKMSTYLVAFVVSDFKYLESKIKTNYTIRVWAREDALPDAEHAVKIGHQSSKFFENFFMVPFPLPKQDMIAIPDFASGAMENWGLITYRETSMLIDNHSTTSRSKLRASSTIAHELAHQWFGNLVTPEWWTELWLNEGFATFMQYIGMNALEPNWKMFDIFIVDTLQPALHLDCLESSHPINVPVTHPDEISEIFDLISYKKGSSVLRMMSNFLTEDTFRKGLSKYLTEKAFKSAVQDDLWRHLTQQAHKDKTLDKNLTVKEIMDTWTLQKGFPVLNVVTDDRNGTATLTQERFLLSKNASSSNTSDSYRWWIPISFASESNPNFNVTNPKFWLSPNESRKIIEINKTGWVIFNNKQTGVYRVNYDKRNWNLIINQLTEKNHTVIDPINRAQLIDDALTLAKAGLLHYEKALTLLSYLKKETEYVPWATALNRLSYINGMFQHTRGYGALREFSLSLILPIYKKLGFEEKENDNFLDKILRVEILTRACSLDYKPCVDKSVELYKAWMKNLNDSSKIPPNLKSLVFCTAIREGGFDEWKFSWDQYKKSIIGSEKILLLSAMGCSKKTWILNGFMSSAIEEGKGIRKQDVARVFISVSGGDVGRIAIFEFLKEKFENIKNYLANVPSIFGAIIKSSTSSLNTKSQIYELKDFLKRNKDGLLPAERAAQQALEKAENNLKWMDNYYQVILERLPANNFRLKI
ncbi:UNVERIFIED_CONTAM: hypothetical protein RMT77_008101 [Armadillidium vulgare]